MKGTKTSPMKEERMLTERITSAKNPLIQHVRKLQASRSYREACGEFVADGWKLLEESLRWYPDITAVIISEGAQCPPLPPQTRVAEVPSSLMERISSMQTPQGVIFLCRLPVEQPLHLQRGMLLLDRIQDPGNLGTILRTADAFDVPVILTNGCADPYSEKTVRASMGAVFRTPPQSAPLDAVLRACRTLDLPISVTALTDRAVDVREAELSDGIVAIGSEGQGVCAELFSAAQKQIIIPMQPRCESLNAAVAASIVMWLIKYR